MHKILFTGPSLNATDIKESNLQSDYIIFDDIQDFISAYPTKENLVILPPIIGGDILKLSQLEDIRAIGIVDGYFKNVTSVWHKEILAIMSQGVEVYGAASMGALRAAELAKFGMKGIGKIFQDFYAGELVDDDEVTVSHGPGDAGFPSISQAMVNIRATIEKAKEQNTLSVKEADFILQKAKDVFYEERNFGLITRLCVSENKLSNESYLKFLEWLENNFVDQKKEDALELLFLFDAMGSFSEFHQQDFSAFEDTMIWRASVG